MKTICIMKKCRGCPEQLKCFGCEVHNYILIKQETTRNIYKCSKCGDMLKLDKNNPCCECINKCKGHVSPIVERGKYQKCNRFNKGERQED